MGCASVNQISSVHRTNATEIIKNTIRNNKNISPYQAVFQILNKYPKVRKVVRESLNPKDINWKTWLLCFE